MPRWLTKAGLRFRTLFRRDDVDRELDDEFRYHLEREIDERLAAGLPIEEARLEARRTMGAIAQSREACRDMRGVNRIEQPIQDLRFALRQLRRHPGFASAAVAMLIVGDAFWLVAAGAALGMICAVAAASLMRRLLFGVQSWDAPTLAAAAGVLIASAMLASYLPTRRPHP